MDAIIPQPGSNQPIVVEDNHHHHGRTSNVHVDIHDRRHDDHNCEDAVRTMGIANLDATQQAGYQNTNHTARVGDRVTAGIERAGYAGINASDRAGDRSVSATERSADALDATMQRLGLHTLTAVNLNGDKNIVETNRNGDKVRDSIERYGIAQLEAIKDTFQTLRHDISRESCDIKDRLCDGFKDGLLQAANNTAAINQAICSSTKELLLQACDNQKDTQLAFKDALLFASQNTAAIQKTLCENAAAAAECCCEIKELVRETGSKTDDLVRDIDRDNLREKVNSLKEELSILRMRATLPPPLVGATAL